jgi:hypothetical protein
MPSRGDRGVGGGVDGGRSVLYRRHRGAGLGALFGKRGHHNAGVTLHRLDIHRERGHAAIDQWRFAVGGLDAGVLIGCS